MYRFIVFIACSLFCLPLFAQEQRLPDMVVYLADDLSAGDLPVHGGKNIATPAIDVLAADGMTFDRAFVASPACGRCTGNLGRTKNDTKLDRSSRPSDVIHDSYLPIET